MNLRRRPLLMASLGALPLAANATPQAATSTAASPSPPPPPEKPPAAFWTSRFPRPEGGELAMADFKGRWLLINFWATWCAPCIKELPDLNSFHQAQAARGKVGWTVLGLAVDSPTPVRQFMARFKPPLQFPIGLTGLSGAELGRQLGNPGGQLPYSLVIDPRGKIVWRRRGVTHREELDTLAKTLA